MASLMSWSLAICLLLIGYTLQGVMPVVALACQGAAIAVLCFWLGWGKEWEHDRIKGVKK